MKDKGKCPELQISNKLYKQMGQRGWRTETNAEAIPDVIEKEFHDIAIIHHKLFLYRPLDAIKVIERCRELNKVVYGIDAFKLWEGDRIQPSMEHSIDYSGISYNQFEPDKYQVMYHIAKNADSGHWKEAIQFIMNRMELGYVFEIVYQE